MSYCVNCGVELNSGAKSCPLCTTPVLNPRQGVQQDDPAFFPAHRAQVEPVSKRQAAILGTAMLGSVSLCCALLNLVLLAQVPWYLFVVGAAAMLWIWLVFPLLAPQVPIWARLTLDVVAVGLYVFFISMAVDGAVWFFGLAVPVLVLATVIVLCLGFLLRRGHSVLTTTMMSLFSVGLFCMGVELACDLYFQEAWAPGWSLVVLACCLGLCIPLVIVRRVPAFREEVRRRFHF